MVQCCQAKGSIMFFKATDQKRDGKAIVLIGADEATATAHYDIGNGSYVEVPLTAEELNKRFSTLCRMNYTNKDGKTYYSSDAETKTTVLRSAAGRVLCKHDGVKWGAKQDKRVSRIAIWEIVDGKPKTTGVPEFHYPETDWKVISALVRQ
jgi:hypothetical protein